MATFTYSARTLAGDIQTGTVDLPSRDEVVNYLRRQKLIPIKVEQKSSGLELSLGSGINTRQIVIFTRQFATMINAGLPLVQSLDILAKQSESKALRKVIEQVLYDVEAGNTLADSMRKHPSAFSDLYVNMVAAGEAGGILDVILLRLATFLEKADALRRKIKGAMVYPAVILVVAAAAVATLLIFVIPTFENMFASAGVPLPLPTRAVIQLSNLLQSYWWALLGVILLSAFLVRQTYKNPAGQLAIDRMLLRVPLMGGLLRKAAIARFTRTLGTLVASGVSILDGLEITARTAGNRVLHDAIMSSRASIACGVTISEPLSRAGGVRLMVAQLINGGEQTALLDEMLTKMASFLEFAMVSAVEALLSVMAPSMIVVLGVVVGGMIVAMY